MNDIIQYILYAISIITCIFCVLITIIKTFRNTGFCLWFKDF